MEIAFTFATNSEKWGGEYDYGKYPVKLYNSSGVLIHQVDSGGDNSKLKPSGGILATGSIASSMNEAVANPITFYGSGPQTVINQSGQSGDLYNYYWTSYSRGTDGQGGNIKLHNLYLDSYIPLRRKSIYDPCPYGYRVPSNGTYNEFTNTGWVLSCTGGIVWTQSWFAATGRRAFIFYNAGRMFMLSSSTATSSDYGYVSALDYGGSYAVRDDYVKSMGVSIRCIEDCDLLPDQTHSSAGY